jgi:amidase
VLNRLTLVEQARLIRAGEVSAKEMVTAHVEAIERENPRINAFVEVYAEQALREASQPAPGPLSGVPVTVKDCIDVAGRPTLCGSRLRSTHQASRDAATVQKLRAAGAIVLGKTNVPEFLLNYESDNHITGRTNHPRDEALTPGGSSGGEAAAIAAHLSAGGVGSDGGGSVRWPAHCCAIVGLKPTPGRISAAGHYPSISHPAGMMGVVGPLARTAGDLRLLFDVLRGYDSQDPFSAPVDRVPRPPQLRIGVWPRFYSTPVQTACAIAVKLAAKALADGGFTVDEFTPQGLERAPNLWSFLFTDLSAPFLREMIADRRDQTHWTGTEFLDAVADHPEASGRRVVEVLSARDAMRAALLRQMEEWPVVLTAGAGMTAFPHRARRYPVDGGEIGLFQGTFPLVWANLLGLPAISVPAGPANVQLVGRPWEEDLLIEIATRLEESVERG